MKKYILTLTLCLEISVAFAQNPLGKNIGRELSKLPLKNKAGNTALFNRFSSKQVAVIEPAAVSIFETQLQASVCDIAVDVVDDNTTSTTGTSVDNMPEILNV